MGLCTGMGADVIFQVQDLRVLCNPYLKSFQNVNGYLCQAITSGETVPVLILCFLLLYILGIPN